MKALQKIGLATLVFGLAACASSKQEAKGEQKPEETTSQPAGQQAPSGSEGTPSPTDSCTFTVSQNICVQVPLTFSANATATPTGIVCGTPATGPCPGV
jgi:hypothetical protein